ncbi:MAG: hypothetical protein WCK03_01040 [Candidatus Taylorbacteria bacterium]
MKSNTTSTQNTANTGTTASTYVPGSYYNSLFGNANNNTNTGSGASQAADYNTLSDLPTENVDVAKTINTVSTTGPARIYSQRDYDMFEAILNNRFPGSKYGPILDITTSSSSPANGNNWYIIQALSSDPRNKPCKYMATDRVARTLHSMLRDRGIQADFITSTSTNYILNYGALGTQVPIRCLDAGFSQNIAAFQTPMYILSSTTYSIAVDYDWVSNYDITKTDFWNDPANQFTIAWNMNVYWQKAQKIPSHLSTLEMNRFAGIKTPITLFHFTASTTGKLTYADANTKLAAMGYRAADTNELFALNKAGLAPYNTVALNSFQIVKAIFLSCDTPGAVESASVPGHCATRLDAVAATGAYNGNGLTMPFNPDTGIRLQDWNFTNGTSFYFAAVKL